MLLNRRAFLQGMAAIAAASALPVLPIEAAIATPDNGAFFASAGKAIASPTSLMLRIDDVDFPLFSAIITVHYRDTRLLFGSIEEPVQSAPRVHYYELAFESAGDFGQYVLHDAPGDATLFVPGVGAYRFRNAELRTSSIEVTHNGRMLISGSIKFRNMEAA